MIEPNPKPDQSAWPRLLGIGALALVIDEKPLDATGTDTEQGADGDTAGEDDGQEHGAATSAG